MAGASTVLLSGIVEETREEFGHEVRSIALSGEPHANAVLEAVRYDYRRRRGLPTFTDENLCALAGQKVTLMRTGESVFGASSIQAQQGTIFLAHGQHAGKAAFLPKGKRNTGIVLDPASILDFEIGYNKAGVLQARVDAVRATFPQVEPLTKDHLLALPQNSNVIGLIVLGTWRGPEGSSPGAIWLINEYMPEHDIVEGVLIVRPEHGTSEHGSVYGDRLLHWSCGKVVNGPELTFADALDLADLDYDDALARITNA